MMECYDLYLKRYTPFFKLKPIEDGIIAELKTSQANANQRNKQTELNWDKSQADAYESRYDNLVEILAYESFLPSSLLSCLRFTLKPSRHFWSLTIATACIIPSTLASRSIM